MNKPFYVGMPVQYRANEADTNARSNYNTTGVVAAVITRVWDGGNMVNLTIFPDDSVPQSRTSVFHEEDAPKGSSYWDFLPIE